MRLEEVGQYLIRGRVIDLSQKAMPGRTTGPLDTGKRKYEIHRFYFPPGEIMHQIEMESHIATHIEAPAHFIPVRHGRKASDISQIPLRAFFGIAVLINCQDLPSRTPIGKRFLKTFAIEEGNIVLLGRCRHLGQSRCYLAKDGVEFLVRKKVKMVGVDDTVFPENPRYERKDLKKYFTHDLLLSNNIPLIEGLANLEKLKRDRFLFFGFPAKMGRLESFPIRAVAIEDP